MIHIEPGVGPGFYVFDEAALKNAVNAAKEADVAVIELPGDVTGADGRADGYAE